MNIRAPRVLSLIFIHLFIDLLVVNLNFSNVGLRMSFRGFLTQFLSVGF